MINRRDFIKNATILGIGIPVLPGSLFKIHKLPTTDSQIVMTVNGPIDPGKMEFTLTHEHILADFIGAEKYSRDRYNADEVFNTALP